MLSVVSVDKDNFLRLTQFFFLMTLKISKLGIRFVANGFSLRMCFLAYKFCESLSLRL